MTRFPFAAVAATAALLAACSGSGGAPANRSEADPAAPANAAAAARPGEAVEANAAALPVAPRPAPGPGDAAARRRTPVEPAAPGTPQGLPDDGRPVSEAPFAATSAQGAADVVQTYYALLEARRFAPARRLWSRGGGASGKSLADFAAAMARYSDYHAQVGAPGAVEGAAGSLYVTVPVSLSGRLRSGAAFREAATVTLRRINDVPGSTPDQRRWHIERIELRTP